MTISKRTFSIFVISVFLISVQSELLKQTCMSSIHSNPYPSSTGGQGTDLAIYSDWSMNNLVVPLENRFVAVHGNSIVGVYSGKSSSPDGLEDLGLRVSIIRENGTDLTWYTETAQNRASWGDDWADSYFIKSHVLSNGSMLVAVVLCNGDSNHNENQNTAQFDDPLCYGSNQQESDGSIIRLFGISFLHNETMDLGTVTYSDCGRQPSSGGTSNWNYNLFTPQVKDISISGNYSNLSVGLAHRHMWYDSSTSNAAGWPTSNTARCKIEFNGTEIDTLPGNTDYAIDEIQISPTGVSLERKVSSLVNIQTLSYGANHTLVWEGRQNGGSWKFNCNLPDGSTVTLSNFSETRHIQSGSKLIPGKLDTGTGYLLSLLDTSNCAIIATFAEVYTLDTNVWTDFMGTTHVIGANTANAAIQYFNTTISVKSTFIAAFDSNGILLTLISTNIPSPYDSVASNPHVSAGFEALATETSNPPVILGRDTDSDGVIDFADVFPSDRFEWLDSDNDGFGDNGDECPLQWGNSTTDREGCADLDGDGVSDLTDSFVSDGTQWSDLDSDGFGDNLTGVRGDFCPSVFGLSARNNTYGCPDTDFDGWADSQDHFPNESSQWMDSDGDGYGDEFNGFEGDSCILTPGNSTIDRFGCIDTDGDGTSDKNDAFPNNPTQTTDRDGDGYGDNQSADATQVDRFPSDTTQWEDADEDGYGDNQNGNLPDRFPYDPDSWQDSDLDGVADEDDAFPNERSQSEDLDGDGYGDNPDGENPDAFPSNPDEWLDTDGDFVGNNEDAFPFDPSQTTDTDGDGFGDNPVGNGADRFPGDPSQWMDIDGDGYGDNQSGAFPDAFITDPTQWSDVDGDGYGDNPGGRQADAFPNDPTQWEDLDGDGLGDSESGNNPDPFLFDFDNDGYNDSIDPLPKLASPGDLDNDGVLDEDDLFPEDFREWADNDGDGVGDNADNDDDNDGWLDADELREGTDPFSSSEQPVDSFEIVIPGTAVGLGAWDLIGIFGGVPLFIWIGFGFITRNGRTAKYEEKLRAATTRDELESVARQWEYSLMLRMLGPHQGIRLERLRAELDDVFERQNQTLSSLEQSEYNQTQLVQNEMNQNEKEVPEINLKPDINAVGNPDENGYEWITSEDGANFYRTIGSSDEWIKFEN
jgi:hypothetical protein